MVKLQNIKIHSICWIWIFAGLSMTFGNLQAQDSGRHTDDPQIVFRSNDWIYWSSNDPEEYYAVDRTPLKNIKGYDTLFSHYVSMTDERTIYEKPYNVLWEIVNNKLYLCDIQFFIFNRWGQGPSDAEIKRYKENANKAKGVKNKIFGIYDLFEQFIGATFRPALSGSQDSVPPKLRGIIPATWVNGTFLLKKHTPLTLLSEEQKLFQDPAKVPPKKSYDQLFREAPVIRVTFKNGQVVSVTDVP